MNKVRNARAHPASAGFIEKLREQPTPPFFAPSLTAVGFSTESGCPGVENEFINPSLPGEPPGLNEIPEHPGEP